MAVIAWIGQPVGAITQVQKKVYSSTGDLGDHVITFDSAPVNGNLLVLCITSDTTVGGVSGTWTLLESQVDHTGTYMYYRVAGASEPQTVTVSLNVTVDSCVMYFTEISGVTTPDQHTGSIGQGATGTIDPGTTGTTTSANEVVIVYAGLSLVGGGRTVTGWSNSFVIDGATSSTGSTNNSGMSACIKIVSATGTYQSTATMSANSGNDSGIIATFK